MVWTRGTYCGDTNCGAVLTLMSGGSDAFDAGAVAVVFFINKLVAVIMSASLACTAWLAVVITMVRFVCGELPMIFGCAIGFVVMIIFWVALPLKTVVVTDVPIEWALDDVVMMGT